MNVTELEALVEHARREWEEAEKEAKVAYHEYVRLCGELRVAEDQEGVNGPDKIPDTPSRTRIPTI